ncbi:antitoxin Xre/MbcA/ParS toxin-binding domain-containing protein [Pseudomonas sp. D(2018)]|uniref:type II RES/Xre toxin-antitoxin system antitoxin n=1 Tax=Pseudomonas sp. D(2018) TaxID=2502238 RepID=UPI0014859902|nr:antitoxin Xre/MbcA/ParS toxin-binding domain-containing protein [Pseudomonas sp. D(2018)]
MAGHDIKAYHPGSEVVSANSIWTATGIPERGPQLIAEVHDGFPINYLESLASELNISAPVLAGHLGMSRPTLHRRLKAGRLSTKESDRLHQAAQVLTSSTGLFEGNQAAAWIWMLAPQLALGGMRPIEMLGTYVGAEAVRDLIGQLEHGVCV